MTHSPHDRAAVPPELAGDLHPVAAAAPVTQRFLHLHRKNWISSAPATLDRHAATPAHGGDWPRPAGPAPATPSPESEAP